MTSNVQEFAGDLWDARYDRRLPRDAAHLARGLAEAVARDVEECATYDPELDMRVLWVREIIGQRRRLPGWKMPKAEPGLEMGVLMILGRQQQESCCCGKVRAIGENPTESDHGK